MSVTVRTDGDAVEIRRGNVSVQVRFTEVTDKGIITPQPRKGALKPPETVSRPGVAKSLNLPPARQVKPHQPGTRRAKVVDLLKRGTTIDKIMAATGWNRNDAREAVRQLHRDLGYGVEEGKGGRLKLIQPATP